MHRLLLAIVATVALGAAGLASADEPLPAPLDVLNPDSVDRVVCKAPAVQACLRKADRAGLELPDKLWIEFTVQPDGSIKDAEVATLGLPAGDLSQCLPDGIEQQQFPAFDSSNAKTIKVPIASRPARR